MTAQSWSHVGNYFRSKWYRQGLWDVGTLTETVNFWTPITTNQSTTGLLMLQATYCQPSVLLSGKKVTCDPHRKSSSNHYSLIILSLRKEWDWIKKIQRLSHSFCLKLVLHWISLLNALLPEYIHSDFQLFQHSLIYSLWTLKMSRDLTVHLFLHLKLDPWVVSAFDIWLLRILCHRVRGLTHSQGIIPVSVRFAWVVVHHMHSPQIGQHQIQFPDIFLFCCTLFFLLFTLMFIPSGNYTRDGSCM